MPMHARAPLATFSIAPPHHSEMGQARRYVNCAFRFTNIHVRCTNILTPDRILIGKSEIKRLHEKNVVIRAQNYKKGICKMLVRLTKNGPIKIIHICF
jgi:hypothetical protein